MASTCISYFLCKLMSWSIEECIYLQCLRFRKNRTELHRQDNIQLIACLNGHFKDQNQLLDTFVKLELIFSCQRDIEDRDKLHMHHKIVCFFTICLKMTFMPFGSKSIKCAFALPIVQNDACPRNMFPWTNFKWQIPYPLLVWHLQR